MHFPDLIPRLAATTLLIAAAGVRAQTAMDFDTAWQHTFERSDRLSAAQAAVQGHELQRQALEGLGGPVVSLSGAAYTYHASLDVDLDPLNQRLGQAGQALPPALQAMLAGLPQLPSKYTLNRRDTAATGALSGVWPLYVGGAGDAARGLADARTREAQSDAAQTSGELETLLVQRYFGAQLAQLAAGLRLTAEATIREHDSAAEKMLASGMIARVERLQARAAYEEAHRNSLKASDDARLAAVALARTVHADAAVKPLTPLFVISQPIEPLPHFVDAALASHPGLRKVASKKSQAEQVHAAEEALRRPSLFAFGTRELKSGNADWVAGIGMRWTLYDSIDRDALAASSLKQVERAERTDAQARSDIALLVEKNWHLVEQARRQFLATQPGIELAQEMLRLREAGLRQGTSTTLDLIDAETNHAKVQTERAQAAYDYVQALAQLLESTGQSEKFSAYIQRADVKVN